MLDVEVVRVAIARFPDYRHMDTSERRDWWFRTFWELRDLEKQCAQQERCPSTASSEDQNGT